MVRRVRVVCALMAVAAVGAAGMTAAAVAAKTTTKNLSVKGTVAYNVKTIKAPAGKVTLKLKNGTAVPHNVAIKGKGLKKPAIGKVVGKGKTSVATATLKAGSYIFYCSVPGHEAAGMKGTLKVTK